MKNENCIEGQKVKMTSWN